MIDFSEDDVVEERRANFHDGSLPSWMTTDHSGGSHTVQDASDKGGYLELATGTTSSGDLASVKTSFPFDVDAHHKIEIRADWEIINPSGVGTARPLYFKEDGAISHLTYHDVISDELRFKSGDGNKTAVNARDIKPSLKHRSRLVWDTEANQIELWLDGVLSARDSGSNLPDDSLTFRPTFLITTSDTAADRLLRVFNIEIRYLTNLRER